MSIFEAASNLGGKVDTVFLYTFALCVAVLLIVTALVVYFTVRYSRKRNPKPVDIEGDVRLEIAWTVIPLILFLAMFYFGWTNFRQMRNPPSDAMVVEVIAKKWEWTFKYPNGKITRELFAALDRPIKLELHSRDVLHGFYIAAFRVKSDVVPGKVNFVWFSPTLLGTFDIQCTVICGVKHSYMLSRVHVVPEAAFKTWYFGPADAPSPIAPAPKPGGKPKAVTTPRASTTPKTGTKPKAAKPASVNVPGAVPAVLSAKDCLACHSVDGSPMVGPTLKGLFGKEQVVRSGGVEKKIVVDTAYLIRSLENPRADVPKGYPPAMPRSRLTPAERDEIVAYIQGLK